MYTMKFLTLLPFRFHIVPLFPFNFNNSLNVIDKRKFVNKQKVNEDFAYVLQVFKVIL